MCAKGTQECAEEMGVYTSHLKLHLCNCVPYFQVHSLAGNRSRMSRTDAEVTDTLNSHTRLTTIAFESGGQLLHRRLCDQNPEDMQWESARCMGAASHATRH